MMATVPHVIAWAGRTKYHADGFLFDWVYYQVQWIKKIWYGVHRCHNVHRKFCKNQLTGWIGGDTDAHMHINFI